MLSKAKKLVPIIGIAILLYLVLEVGASNIINAMLGANVTYLMLAIVLVVPYLLLQTHKWWYIIRKLEGPLGFSYLLKIYIIGTFWSVITPGKIGTFSRIAYIKRKTGKDLGESSLSVVLDKMLDMFALFMLAIIGGVLLTGYVSGMMLVMMAVLFAAFIVMSALLMKKSTSRALMRLVHRFILPQRFRSGAHKSFNSFYKSVPSIRRLVVPFVSTALSWIVIYSANHFVALSLGIHVPWHIFVTLFPIATIIGLIPITVSGWGTREAVLIGLLAPFAATAESVIAMSILIFFMTGVPPAALGAILSFSEK